MILTSACGLAILPIRQAAKETNVDTQTQARFEARAKIVKAMAHPTRLFMVEELAKGERCVCELTEMVGADMSTVSKHLSVLKAAGILDDKRRGSQVFYALRCPCVLHFFECVETVMKRNAEEQLALMT